MVNNLGLSPDAQLSFALASLRELEFSGNVAGSQHLVPGIFFSIDPNSTDTVQVESQTGEMLSAKFAVDGPGRWLTLNLSIGRASLAATKIIGFACRLDAPVTTTFRAFVRSGVEGGRKDTYFAKTVVAYPKTAVHLDVIDLDTAPDFPREAEWRELVFFFRRETSEINLRDIRLILI